MPTTDDLLGSSTDYVALEAQPTDVSEASKANEALTINPEYSSSNEESNDDIESTTGNSEPARYEFANSLSKAIEVFTVGTMINAPFILNSQAWTPMLAGIFFSPGLHPNFQGKCNLDKKGVLAAGATLTLSALTDSFKQFPAAKNLLSISCAIGQAIITYGFALNRPEKAPWLEKHGYLFILAATAADAIKYNKDVVSVFHDSYNDSNFSHVINALWCLTFIFKLASDHELHKKAGGALSNCSFFCKEQSGNGAATNESAPYQPWSFG